MSKVKEKNKMENKKYSFQTLIEPDPQGDHRVVGQDGSLPLPLFLGTKEECEKWQKENCE